MPVCGLRRATTLESRTFRFCCSRSGYKSPTGGRERETERESARRWTLTTSQLRSLQSTGMAPVSLRCRGRQTLSRAPAFSPLSVVMSKLSLRVPPPPTSFRGNARRDMGRFRATVVSSWPFYNCLMVSKRWVSIWWGHFSIGSSHYFDWNVDANCQIPHSDRLIWQWTSLDLVTSESSNHHLTLHGTATTGLFRRGPSVSVEGYGRVRGRDAQWRRC